MEEKIQELLQEHYNENIKVKVEYFDLREYRIIVKAFNQFETSFIYTYNGKYTLQSNVLNIVEMIESKFLYKLFYKNVSRETD